MFSLSQTQEFITAATAFLIALATVLKILLPIGRKIDDMKSTLDSMSELLRHEWVTNGKTGLRDTITLALHKLDSIEERLSRGDQRFDDIEAGQAEAARRAEAIQSTVDALLRDMERRPG